MKPSSQRNLLPVLWSKHTVDLKRCSFQLSVCWWCAVKRGLTGWSFWGMCSEQASICFPRSAELMRAADRPLSLSSANKSQQVAESYDLSFSSASRSLRGASARITKTNICKSLQLNRPSPPTHILSKQQRKQPEAINSVLQVIHNCEEAVASVNVRTRTWTFKDVQCFIRTTATVSHFQLTAVHCNNDKRPS